MKPTYLESAYECPFCEENAQQKWYLGCVPSNELQVGPEDSDIRVKKFKSGVSITEKAKYREIPDIHFTRCMNCRSVSIWNHNKMIFHNLKQKVLKKMGSKTDFLKQKFRCPYCDAIARQKWFQGHALVASLQQENLLFTLSYPGFPVIDGKTDYTIPEQTMDLSLGVEFSGSSKIRKITGVYFSQCGVDICCKISVWVNNELIFPNKILSD